MDYPAALVPVLANLRGVDIKLPLPLKDYTSGKNNALAPAPEYSSIPSEEQTLPTITEGPPPQCMSWRYCIRTCANIFFVVHKAAKYGALSPKKVEKIPKESNPKKRKGNRCEVTKHQPCVKFRACFCIKEFSKK